MRIIPPRFERVVCVGANPALVAAISSLFNTKRGYFAVFEEPRLTRPDWSNEVIRVNNGIARVRPDYIIYAAVSPEVRRAFVPYIPEAKVIEINNFEDIPGKLPEVLCQSAGDLPWSEQDLACGVVAAKRLGKRLSPATNAPARDSHPETLTGHIVICEARTDVAPIIAGNYAHAIGAALILIPEPSRETVDEINERLYSLYAPGSAEPIPARLAALKCRIRGLLGGIDFLGYSGATFITFGIPYGLAVAEIPTTHLFSYPFLGVSLAEGISAEHREEGARVALLVEPGDLAGSETEVIARVLSRRRMVTKVLTGDHARAYAVARHIEVFPYDVLVISCHASEVPGRRETYKYTDREGRDRTLIVDSSVAFAPVPGSDQVQVTQFTRFVSLDGIDWHDEEAKKTLYVGTAIRDFAEMGIGRLRPAEVTPVPRVRGAMALRVVGGEIMPMPHVVADDNHPLVFCNACASWHEIARRMVFGGARAYIGTLFDVTGMEAKAFAEALFVRHFDEPLAFSVWQTQREVYTETRRPYIMVGPHFVTLKPCRIHAAGYLVRRLAWGLRRWEEKRDTATEEDVRRNSQQFADFLQEQIDTIPTEWSHFL